MRTERERAIIKNRVVAPDSSEAANASRPSNDENTNHLEEFTLL
jgi:hypothetical protein